MKKKLAIAISLMIFILVLTNKVFATGSYNIGLSSSNVKLGESVTLSITGNDAYGEVTISATNAKVSSSSVFLENDTKTVTITPTVEGVVNITVAPSKNGLGDKNETPIETVKTATIQVKNTNTSSNENQGNNNQSGGNQNNQSNENQSNVNSNAGEKTNNTPSETKSKDATLSNLGITPNDFSGFSPSKTSYNVTVPNNVENIEIYAKKGQSAQTITGTGKKALQEGKNTFPVVVTAQDGTTKKTYTIAVTREKSTTEENAPEETEETEETSANTENTENEEEATGQISFGLSNLTLEGISLTPEFKTDIYEYKAKLIGDKTDISIDTTATEENAKIEITGNEELKEGENIITILVTDESGAKNVTYQIMLTKNLVDEYAIANQKKMEEEKKQRKIILIAAVITLVVLVATIGIMIHKKRNRYVDDYTIPYSSLNSEDNNIYMEDGKYIKYDDMQRESTDESTNELTDEDEYKEEKMKKKKHGKGKRFK